MRTILCLLCLLAFHASAQPLVKEGKTVRISEHVHVIPDELVPMVPNVGIVVGTYRDYFTARRARVGALKRAGKSAEETVEAVRAEFPAKYPDWRQPLRVVAAANAIYAEGP
jgi:hypothetical protein